MNIPINKNFDIYKNRATLGFSMREVLTLFLVGTIAFFFILFFTSVCHLPMQLSILLSVIPGLPIALRGMTPALVDNHKAKQRLQLHPAYVFKSNDTPHTPLVPLKKQAFTGKEKRIEKPIFTNPRSTQEWLDFFKLFSDGMMQWREGLYSKSYVFADTSYSLQEIDGQEYILDEMKKIFSAQSDTIQLTLLNLAADRERLISSLIAPHKEGLDPIIVNAYNELITNALNSKKYDLEHIKIITLSTKADSPALATSKFFHLENEVSKHLIAIGSALFPMNASDRLGVLYRFFHPHDTNTFTYHYKEEMKRGYDPVNKVVPDYIKEKSDHIEFDGHFTRCLYIRETGSDLKDSFLKELMEKPYRMIFSLSLAPTSPVETEERLLNGLSNVNRKIDRERRARQKNHDFSAEVGKEKRDEKEELENLIDEVKQHDQRIYYAAISIVIDCDTLEELTIATEAIIDSCKSESIIARVHKLRQRENLITSLPFGKRYIDITRPLLTNSIMAFNPFSCVEIIQPGLFYGRNELNTNILSCDRKDLANPHGVRIGTSGSGKTFANQLEKLAVYLTSNDHIIILDLLNEYKPFTEGLGGQYIEIDLNTKNYINPLQMPEVVENRKLFISEKLSLMLGIYEQLTGKVANGSHFSVLDKALTIVYKQATKANFQPTLINLCTALNAIGTETALQMQEELEVLASGTLDLFSHPDNVNLDNRLITFGVRDMSDSIRNVAMLIILDYIRRRALKNGDENIATWVDVEEIHVLLRHEYSSKEICNMWKTYRHNKVIMTGLTQNLADLLHTKYIETILNNSEFMEMLKQSANDMEDILDSTTITPAELSYCKNSKRGHGLIKFGVKIVPHDRTIDENSPLCQLFSKDLFK